MTHRFLSRRLVAVLAAVSASCTTPTPPSPPDLSGTWDHMGSGGFGVEFVRGEKLPDGSVCVFGCAPGPEPPGAPAQDFPKYKPEFLAKVKDLSDRQVQHDTVLQCQPPGVPRIGPPEKIIQNAREVVFLYDDVSGGFFRIIPTDVRPHRTDLPPSYLGDATGWFEGDTLVVETVNFNEETWLTDNGAFHTRDLKVIERLRRVGDTIEYQAVVHDPALLIEPWALRPQKLWLAARELEESARCEDRDLSHMVDGSYHENPR